MINADIRFLGKELIVMLTLSYSAELFSMEKDFIGRAVVLSNTKDIALLAVDDDVYNELVSDMIIVFFDEVKGVMTTHCVITGYHEPVNNKDSYTVTCKLQKIYSVMQRRSDVYARIDMNVELLKVKAIKNFDGNRSIHYDEKPVLAKIKNISASGMYFSTQNDLEKTNVVSANLMRICKNAEFVMADILRREKIKGRNGNIIGYGYGCRFLSLTRSLESSIRQFVYVENRKQLQARKRYLQ